MGKNCVCCGLVDVWGGAFESLRFFVVVLVLGLSGAAGVMRLGVDDEGCGVLIPDFRRDSRTLFVRAGRGVSKFS